MEESKKVKQAKAQAATAEIFAASAGNSAVSPVLAVAGENVVSTEGSSAVFVAGQNLVLARRAYLHPLA